MKNKLLLFLSASALTLSTGFAQQKCGYDNVIDHYSNSYPGYKQAAINDYLELINSLNNPNERDNETDKLYTIRVVFHVLWKTDSTVSNGQMLKYNRIKQQIDALNRDYSGTNPDFVNLRPEFAPFAAGDTRIRFALATVDPQGNPTNGIEYRQTQIESFNSAISGGGAAEGVKKYATGGLDAWDPARYLNIWSCNMLQLVGATPTILLGYATPPNQLMPYWEDNGYDPEMQGVVLQHQIVGNTGNAFGLATKGRTAVHEVGHYLGLRHIWGDNQGTGSCDRDDYFWDTPYADASTDINPPCNGTAYVGNKFTTTAATGPAIPLTPATFSYKTTPTYTTFYNSATQLTDSTMRNQIVIVKFDNLVGATNTDGTIPTDTIYVWQAGYNNYYYNNVGAIIDTVFVSPEQTIINQSFNLNLFNNTCKKHVIEINGNDTIDYGDFNDMFENYMDYSDDGCLITFTKRQKSLMQTVLNIRRTDIAEVTINGVNAIEYAQKLMVFPNPANNEITIKNSNVNSNYEIADIAGNLVLQGKMATDGKIIISTLSNGVYTIKANSKNNILFNKIVVTK